MITNKIEKKILFFLKDKLDSNHEGVSNSEIASSITEEIDKVISKTHLLETRGLLQWSSQSPGNPQTNSYKITGIGIDSLRIDYRKIGVEIAVGIAAIASVMTLLSQQ